MPMCGLHGLSPGHVQGKIAPAVPLNDANAWSRWLFDPAKVNPLYFRSRLTWVALLLHLLGLTLFVGLLALDSVSRFLGIVPLEALGLASLSATPRTLMTWWAQRQRERYNSLLYETASAHANFAIIAAFLALSRQPLTPLWTLYLLYVGVVANCFGFQGCFLVGIALSGLAPALWWQRLAAGEANASSWMVSWSFTFFGLWQYIFLANMRDQAFRLNARTRWLEQQRRLNEERARISRDLHDGLGAQLAGAILASNVALRQLSAAQVSLDEVERATETMRNKIVRAGRELQLALWFGRAPGTSLRDLLHQLERSMGEVCRASQVALLTTFGEGVDAPLDEIQRHNLMRILEEATSNALIHGRPRRLELSARQRDNVLEISVKDDGVGMPQDGEGRGLNNMRRRVRELGGTLVIAPLSAAGTSVSVKVPLSAAATPGPAGPEVAHLGDGPTGARRATADRRRTEEPWPTRLGSSRTTGR